MDSPERHCHLVRLLIRIRGRAFESLPGDRLRIYCGLSQLLKANYVTVVYHRVLILIIQLVIVRASESVVKQTTCSASVRVTTAVNRY